MNDAFFHLLNYFALLYPSVVIMFTLEGFLVAFFAFLLGDRAPYENGFLSLNPLAHIEAIGLTVLMIILLLVNALLGSGGFGVTLFGWIAVFAIRYTYSMPLSTTSVIKKGFIHLSVPLSYALIALGVKYCFFYLPFELFSLPFKKIAVQLLQMLGVISLSMCIFQLVPLYPLSMARALICFFPRTFGEFFQQIEEYSFLIIITFFTLLDLFAPGFFIWGVHYLDMLLSYLVF